MADRRGVPFCKFEVNFFFDKIESTYVHTVISIKISHPKTLEIELLGSKIPCNTIALKVVKTDGFFKRDSGSSVKKYFYIISWHWIIFNRSFHHRNNLDLHGMQMWLIIKLILILGSVFMNFTQSSVHTVCRAK